MLPFSWLLSSILGVLLHTLQACFGIQLQTLPLKKSIFKAASASWGLNITSAQVLQKSKTLKTVTLLKFLVLSYRPEISEIAHLLSSSSSSISCSNNVSSSCLTVSCLENTDCYFSIVTITFVMVMLSCTGVTWRTSVDDRFGTLCAAYSV